MLQLGARQKFRVARNVGQQQVAFAGLIFVPHVRPRFPRITKHLTGFYARRLNSLPRPTKVPGVALHANLKPRCSHSSRQICNCSWGEVVASVTRLSRITSRARFGGIGTSRTAETAETAEGQIPVLA